MKIHRWKESHEHSIYDILKISSGFSCYLYVLSSEKVFNKLFVDDLLGPFQTSNFACSECNSNNR